ncbi:lipin Smp2, putative [Talaromyces stipitatus ATCC 10500]|uniref:Lipin Smp2, putative n=1 Tax=Talaromyces stipitatus (strain ATCC 10500 / CBS 375.48 / QM 6759 / NRRL 1006) TaxID=441959 RepID=B8M2Z1_TALSN|nr:lipin Smp2, putative [Talaromyces stipitatus ATCC 10500]EED22246.1 lipin Smp2, putative [Talaromyces stipitatus ATCC 10500]
MQYVRSLSGPVSKTWNSINPATLSGAIDVIVIEHEDGSLACSPFHVRFGKFSLLRPSEKKVEFRVNGVKQDYSMKLGDGGEAFFVFETTDNVPAALQTSPIVSPASSPATSVDELPSLQEPPDLYLDGANSSKVECRDPVGIPVPTDRFGSHNFGNLTPLSQSPSSSTIPRNRLDSFDDSTLVPKLDRSASDGVLPQDRETLGSEFSSPASLLRAGNRANPHQDRHSMSPPPVSPSEAISRAIALSKKLSGSNIPSQVTESGDLMLDMTGYKSSEEDALRAEVVARKILSEELEGNYDIGALIGADDHGNLWIYSSEEAKAAADRRATLNSLKSHPVPFSDDAVSDPGYHSDGEPSTLQHPIQTRHHRTQSDVQPGSPTPPQTPPQDASVGDPNRNYAKTLRLTSDQLKALNLKPGANPVSFTVNKATCPATMYLWSYKTPIVISDIDGTITKSDVLGHVLNMIGRDWTHQGVAKLFTDIVSNGYNIMYLTSRSTGQADSTRTYLNGVLQEGYRLPKGPVIMSPDRTIAALRREIYLRKPEVFKMACLRDILNLFPPNHNPFYAGFGNRLTDALSYRSVNIPSSRIFTINSNAEVSLDLLSLNKYKSSYVTMRELVDHFFPPVSLLVQGGGEEFTDFTYWREHANLDDFSVTDSEEEEEERDIESERGYSDDDASDLDEDEQGDDMGDSFISRDSLDDPELAGSMANSVLEDEEEIPDEELSEADDGLPDI